MFGLRPGLLMLGIFLVGGPACAVDLSPARWDARDRSALERLEQAARPTANRIVEGPHGLVAGTMSPIANRVGLEALAHGGTAADAATAVAFAQVSRALGSFVSYAGIAQILYFDAQSGRVHALNAGWASYLGETDPKTIPGPTTPEAAGRKTMVPGFMAGIGALHQRFGALPWANLLTPSIWYAEKGVPVSDRLAGYFRLRAKDFNRTADGREFMRQAGADAPKSGTMFVQPRLAETLHAVAQHGPAYMYTGAWAQHFVETVRGAGGHATLEDLARYQATWEEPLSTTFAGHTIYAPGRATEGGYQALAALNLIEALKIEQMPPYWQEPDSFLALSRVLNITDLPPRWMLDRARQKGVDLALDERAEKTFAATLAPLVKDFFARPQSAATNPSAHTAGIVVIDRHGNVAAIVHSINSVLWGSTGLVVDGIPLSDPAAIAQDALAALAPGARVSDLMTPIIATRDGKPALAVAITGALHRETVRIVVGLLGHQTDLVTLSLIHI